MNFIFGMLFLWAVVYFLREGFKMKPKDPEDGPKWWWFVNWNRNDHDGKGDGQ